MAVVITAVIYEEGLLIHRETDEESIVARFSGVYRERIELKLIKRQMNSVDCIRLIGKQTHAR